MRRISKKFRLSFILLFALITAFSGCNTIDLFEKVVTIPKQEWKSSFKPAFEFTIKDTAAVYHVYIIVRHGDRYNFNNLWINLYTLSPDKKQSRAQYELPLANNNQGWLTNSAMDDIYEHRIALTPANQGVSFSKAGTYRFTLEHIMREDPLKHMLDVGLRIEKKVAE
jgi:gliding motility-associated lipoprotein GldH